MEFFDFHLRAWQADPDQIEVLVHSSPAGGMERPARVKFDLTRLDAAGRQYGDWRGYDQLTLGQIVELGGHLAEALLPTPVQTLLDRSLASVGQGDGLRLRLCLDEALNDLPWEFLRRPDSAPGPLAGFLALDPRISIVRGAPTLMRSVEPSDRALRMVFVGALWSNADQWAVEQEYERLRQALSPASELLHLDPFRPASGVSIETALASEAAIFHYSGHTDRDGDQGYLVREVVPRADHNEVDRLYSGQLAGLLHRAAVKLALFSACNSGYRVFAQPLMAAGLPALVGAQGPVTTVAAERFCDVLYRFIGAGLSLDEAVTAGRAALVRQVDPDEPDSFDWGRFMVYLAAQDAVLLPRPESLAASQERARRERQVIINVAGDLVRGDKIDSQTYTGGGAYIEGDVSAGGNFAGRDQTLARAPSSPDLEPLFAQLLDAVARHAPVDQQQAAVQRIQALKGEIAKGDLAEDAKIATIVDDLVDRVPDAVPAISHLFATSVLQGVVGPVTRFVLDTRNQPR